MGQTLNLAYVEPIDMCVCVRVQQASAVSGTQSLARSISLYVCKQCAIVHFKIDAFHYDIFEIFSQPSNMCGFFSSVAHRERVCNVFTIQRTLFQSFFK